MDMKEEFALGVPTDKVPTSNPVIYNGQAYNLIEVDAYITKISRDKEAIEGAKKFKVAYDAEKRVFDILDEVK